MTHSAKVIEHWLDSIDSCGTEITDWEDDLLADIQKQFEERGSISDKQEEILERIYSERRGLNEAT